MANKFKKKNGRLVQDHLGQLPNMNNMVGNNMNSNSIARIVGRIQVKTRINSKSLSNLLTLIAIKTSEIRTKLILFLRWTVFSNEIKFKAISYFHTR